MHLHNIADSIRTTIEQSLMHLALDRLYSIGPNKDMGDYGNMQQIQTFNARPT